MKYVSQFAIIIVISLAGELMNNFIPLPIPASIYGMLILFLLLASGLLKLSAVKETGKFLVYLLPIMFVPPTVGLIDFWGEMQDFLAAILIISFLSTALVLGITGRVTQFIIKIKDKGGNKND